MPEQFVRPEVEYIRRWDFAREVQPGLFVHTDYDLTRPSVDLLTQKALPRTYTPSDYEIYDYPGYYVQKPDGEHYAAVRIDEFGTQFETAQADTNARGVAVGSLFTLDGYPRADQNREHVIIGASYDLQFSDYEAMPTDEGPPSYACSFVAMSSEQQFRPKRATPKPFVQGPQTAVVVGPAGEEIYTDEYGRVKVQFHWDRDGKNDQNSSCWIRVSQAWAGKGWGSVSHAAHRPRGDRRLPGRRSGPADHHSAACTTPSNTAAAHRRRQRLQVEHAQGRGLQPDDDGRHGRAKRRSRFTASTTWTRLCEHDQTITVNTGNRTMTIVAGTLTDTVKGNASLTVQAGSRTVSVTGGDYSATASAAVILHGKGKGVAIIGDAKGVAITGNGRVWRSSAMPRVSASRGTLKALTLSATVKVSAL